MLLRLKNQPVGSTPIHDHIGGLGGAESYSHLIIARRIGFQLKMCTGELVNVVPDLDMYFTSSWHIFSLF